MDSPEESEMLNVCYICGSTPVCKGKRDVEACPKSNVNPLLELTKKFSKWDAAIAAWE